MKSLKSLLIPFIVMIVLAAVAIAVVVKNSKDSTEQTEVQEQQNVLSIGSGVISSIEVVRQDETGIGFQGSIDAGGNTIWSLMDKYYVDVPLNNSGISSWVFILSNFLTSGTVGDSSELNLAEYGLDNPVYTIIITQYDGSVDTIYIGNKTATGTDCYFMLDGDPNVYTVAAAKYTYCSYMVIDFLESAGLGIDYASIATVEFKRATDDTDLLITCALSDNGDPIYTAISPYNIECSPYFTTMLDKIIFMEITAYVDIPDEELADYGLVDPTYEFTFTLHDGRVINVALSSVIDGYYYGTSNIVDGYFKISEMQITGIDTQLMMLLGSYLVYYPASDMSKITGTYGDETFVYDIDTTGSISAEDATALLNQRDARVFTTEGRSYAAILYESLITISVSGTDIEANPAFEPVLEFEFITTDHNTYTLSFVPRDNNSYYAFLNGEYSCFYVPASELFNNGGTDTYNYGAWAAYELAREAIDNAAGGIYDIPETEEAA